MRGRKTSIRTQRLTGGTPLLLHHPQADHWVPCTSLSNYRPCMCQLKQIHIILTGGHPQELIQPGVIAVCLCVKAFNTSLQVLMYLRLIKEYKYVIKKEENPSGMKTMCTNSTSHTHTHTHVCINSHGKTISREKQGYEWYFIKNRFIYCTALHVLCLKTRPTDCFSKHTNTQL